MDFVGLYGLLNTYVIVTKIFNLCATRLNMSVVAAKCIFEVVLSSINSLMVLLVFVDIELEEIAICYVTVVCITTYCILYEFELSWTETATFAGV